MLVFNELIKKFGHHEKNLLQYQKASATFKSSKRNSQRGDTMKLYLLRYMDIMTGFTGYMNVRANSLDEAAKLLESKYEDFEVIMDDLAV